MSLLNNNIKALELVSAMSRDELSARLGSREPVSGFITASIWNTDTERRKERLLNANPAGIVAGLKALQVLTGAQGAVIVTLAEGVEDALLKAAEEAELTLCIEKKADLVKFDHRDDLLIPLDEAAALAAVLCGEEAGVLVAVDDGDLAELPPETKLSDILKPPFKAMMTDHRFYAPAEIESMTLKDLASKSGVLRMLTEADCLVDRAKKEIQILREKSCGRCTFCREGLFQLSAIAEDLTTGRLKPQALDLAKELTDAMLIATNCSLGETAGCPMASLLTAFPQEVEAHARRKECPAGVCAAFMTFYVDPAKCVGSRDCVKVCSSHAIEYRPGYTSVIESFDCTRCGACLTVCTQNAIMKVSGRAKVPDKPARLKNAAVEESVPVEEEAPARREGMGKRKRSFARPAGSAVPAVRTAQAASGPAEAAAPAPVPTETSVPMESTAPSTPASARVIRRDTGRKRKRVYAKPIKPER